MAAIFGCHSFCQAQQPTKTETLVKQADQMRVLLIEHYSDSELFGELLVNNSKIRGAALRLDNRTNSIKGQKQEVADFDQLLLDLETKIEQANFQRSRNAVTAVSKQLGTMVSSIHSLKSASKKSPSVVPSSPTESNAIGRLKSVVETEFAPQLAGAGSEPKDINSPLIMGPDSDLSIPPALQFMQPQITVNEVDATPRSLVGPTADGTVQLPDLTIPSPELVDQSLNQSALKPRSLPTEPQFFDSHRLPQLQAPSPTNYGTNVIRSRSQFTIPIQFEFYSFNPGGFFGYQPYGGYWGISGYRGYGSYGRFCPNRW